MITYPLAFLQSRQGLSYRQTLCAADEASLLDTYPVRPGELRVLTFARGEGCRRAPFLLGCMRYHMRCYEAAAALFEENIHLEPENYMPYRCLAVAYFTHLGRKEEAARLMETARSLNCSQQILYESVILMDLSGASAAEKLALLEPHASGFRRDDLFVELAKAYNQSFQPEKALALLNSHVFVSCEGGEHAIADQYMYALFQQGMRKKQAQDYAGAYETLRSAMTLPQSLGSGIWNRCKYVPYQFHMAQCLEQLGRTEEAHEIYQMILDIEIEFFSKIHLRELPYYQALCAEALGQQPRAWDIMTRVKRAWSLELDRVDNGFFATTPFFISFAPEPRLARRAYYLYLLGLVSLYEGVRQEADARFRESYALNSDNLFCHYYAHLLP